MIDLTLTTTEAFVRQAFGDMTDRAGVSLADHAERVVENLGDVDEVTKHVAWLHDVLEDTDADISHYPDEVKTAVDLLTWDRKALTYAEYIDRICESGNRHAILVKLADQKDNLDPKRWQALNRYVQNALRKRYAGVWEKLMEAAIKC